MFELVDGEKKRQIAFGHYDSINIDNIKFKERVYFVQGVYRIFDRPKYIEFTSVFSAYDNAPTDLIDFITGAKVIYGYTCYNTTNPYYPRYNDKEPYEHSITFVENK